MHIGQRLTLDEMRDELRDLLAIAAKHAMWPDALSERILWLSNEIAREEARIDPAQLSMKIEDAT